MPYTEALSVLKSIGEGKCECSAQHKPMLNDTPEITIWRMVPRIHKDAPAFFTVADIHTYIGFTGIVHRFFRVRSLMIGWIILIALVLIIIFLIGMYNSLVRLKVTCDNRSEEHTSELQSHLNL